MRFAVRFLGCKVSLADAALIRDALIDAGHVEAPQEAAEVQVVNGVNLPMLVRVLNYSRLSLAELVDKAVSGGHDGVFCWRPHGSRMPEKRQ